MDKSRLDKSRLDKPTKSPPFISNELLALAQRAEQATGRARRFRGAPRAVNERELTTLAYHLFMGAAKEGISLYQILCDHREIRQFIERPHDFSDDCPLGHGYKPEVAKANFSSHRDPSRPVINGITAPPIGSRIVSALKAKGLSRLELADAVDVSKGSINFWITGFRCPTDQNLATVAAVLGVTVPWLCGQDD